MKSLIRACAAIALALPLAAQLVTIKPTDTLQKSKDDINYNFQWLMTNKAEIGGPLSGNSNTATALAVTPTGCTNQVATGIAANGNASYCTFPPASRTHGPVRWAWNFAYSSRRRCNTLSAPAERTIFFTIGTASACAARAS